MDENIILNGLCFYTEFLRGFSVRLRTKWLWVSQCGEGTDVKVCLGETMTNKLTTDKCIGKYIGLISVKGR